MNVVHEKLRPHKIDLCNKSFGHKSSLTEHKNEVHEKIRPQKYNICQKTFSCNWSLIKHKNAVQGVMY